MNHVSLNLPVHAGAPLPDPKKAVVTINGVEIEEVLAVSVDASAGAFTKVTITFGAQVGDAVNVPDWAKKANNEQT